MSKYDWYIADYQEQFLDNQELSFKEYCCINHINYDCAKAYMYRKGIHIKVLRGRNCLTGRVTIPINNEIVKKLVSEYLNTKAALWAISSQDANEVISMMEKLIKTETGFNEDLFWQLYAKCQEKKHLFPTALRFLFRIFLFIVNKYGTKEVFSSKLLIEHFRDVAFRKFIEENTIQDPSQIRLYHYTAGNRKISSYQYLNFQDKHLLSLYNEFVKDIQREGDLKNVRLFSRVFEESIRQNQSKDITICEESFWLQIKYFTEGPFNNEYKQRAIKHIVQFYIFYIERCHKHKLVFDSKVLTLPLLKCISFCSYIVNGYSFLTFDEAQKKSTKPNKIVILIDNLAQITNRKANRDFITLDCSKIDDVQYLQIAMDYCLSSKENLIYTSHFVGCIIDILNYLSKSKQEKGEDKNLLTLHDAKNIYSYIINKSKSAANANSKLSLIKNLFLWAYKTDLIKVKNYFFEVFSCVYVSSGKDPKAIPLKHATLIAQKLFEKGKESLAYKHYFTLLVLLLETEFRPSQLCAIEEGKFNIIQSRGTYILQGISKTSKGDLEKWAISSYSYSLLNKAKEYTYNLRTACADEHYNKYLFIYPPEPRSIKQGIRVITAPRFSEIVGDICKSLSIPHYTAINFRYTHMTFAQKYDSLNKGEGFFLRVLSGHKTEITTKEHYVDRTYNILSGVPSGFSIGTEEELQEIESRIRTNIPQNMRADSHSTMDNIGFCSLNQCTFSTMISCVLCPHIHYIADQDEKPLNMMLEAIEDELSTCTNSHEREHKIQLKDAIQKRLIAIASFKSKSKNIQ